MYAAKPAFAADARKLRAVEGNVSANESYTMVLPEVNAAHISLCCLSANLVKVRFRASQMSDMGRKPTSTRVRYRPEASVIGLTTA